MLIWLVIWAEALRAVRPGPGVLRKRRPYVTVSGCLYGSRDRPPEWRMAARHVWRRGLGGGNLGAAGTESEGACRRLVTIAKRRSAIASGAPFGQWIVRGWGHE